MYNSNLFYFYCIIMSKFVEFCREQKMGIFFLLRVNNGCIDAIFNFLSTE